MASIDISKLVQESVSNLTSEKSENIEENTVAIDIKKIEEENTRLFQRYVAKGKALKTAKQKNKDLKTKAIAGATLTGAAGIAAGVIGGKLDSKAKHAAELKKMSGVSGSLKNAYSETKRAAKEKLADAHSKASGAVSQTSDRVKELASGAQDKVVKAGQSMGTHLKSLGKAALEKAKENPKTAAGIAAGTAGAIGAGIAAKKYLAMRKKRKAAA